MSTLAPRADGAHVTHVSSDPSAESTSFWQRPFVQDVMPFLASLAIHLCILALGLITYTTVGVILKYDNREPFVIPEPTIDMPDKSAAVGPVGFEDGTDVEAGREKLFDAPPDTTGLATNPAVNPASLLMGNAGNSGGGAKDGGNDDSIAVGPLSTFGKGGKGVGNAMGEGTGGDNGNGILAPWRDKDMRPWGVTLMRSHGYARKVAFVCDASGSMLNKFDSLRIELRKAIDTLRPVQQFNIIFFNDTAHVLDRELLMAVPEVKRKAYEFMDGVSASGSTEPVAALRAAFAARPQLIFLLTDGDFPNNAEVLAEIARLNADKRVMINTIAFMDRGEEYEKLLQRIARENGGVFKFVSDSDLQR